MDIDAAMDVDEHFHVSPSSYLIAIQSLFGQTPQEKYKELNVIINDIVSTCRESNVQLESVIASRQIPDSLLPLVRILAAKKLKLRRVILESLKSTNLQVVNHALRTKWFFDGTNSEVTAPYFVKQVFSIVSLRTRSKIIKLLARGMQKPGLEPKAEQFFETLLNAYSLTVAMPFLPYCSENFISSAIVVHDIKLSVKMLDLVYRRYPTLAILYLYYGNHLLDSDKERKKFKNREHLYTYKNFLVRLIKHHTADYMKLSEKLNGYYKIGNGRTRYLFKNAVNLLLNEPKKYLPFLNDKVLYYCLSRRQFTEMYCNLFPKVESSFSFYEMITYLKYFPKFERLNFMIQQYKNVYKKDLFDSIVNRKIYLINLKSITELLTEEDFEKVYCSRIIFPNYTNDFSVDDAINFLMYYPKEKQLDLLKKAFWQRLSRNLMDQPVDHLASEKFLRLLPADERGKLAKNIVKECVDKKQSPNRWYIFLPIEESFVIIKEQMKNLPIQRRIEWLLKMISACEIYDDKTYFLEFLNYFNTRYKNIQSPMLHQILKFLLEKFEIQKFDTACFQVFYEIILRAYVKDELFSLNNQSFEMMFSGIVHRLVLQSKLQIVEPEIRSIFERTVDMYLEYKIEFRDSTTWKILQGVPELELECIGMLIHHISRNYPDEHSIWKEPTEKLRVVIKLIEKLHKYNLNLIQNAEVNGSNVDEVRQELTRVKNYPWLMKSVIDILIAKKDDKVGTDNLVTSLREYDEEFYHSIVNEPVDIDYLEDIKSGIATLLLKRDPEKIFTSWEHYFSACRKLLSSNSWAAKKFVLSTKWHNQLPVKFVERSLLELDQSGSMTILALLLDGSDLEKIIKPHLPAGPTLEVHGKDARKQYRMTTYIPRAINVSMPPFSSDILLKLFFGDYVCQAVRSLDNLTWRLEKSEILTLAEKLMNNPSSNVNRHGPRLVFKVTSSEELGEFVSRILLDRHHQSSVVEVIAKKLLQRFIVQSSEQNWSLVKICISGVRKSDTGAITALCNISSLSDNAYASKYIQNLLARIDRLTEKHGMEKYFRDKCIIDILSNISKSVAVALPKEMVLDTIRKYYFHSPSQQVSYAAQSFAKNCVNRPFVPPV